MTVELVPYLSPQGDLGSVTLDDLAEAAMLEHGRAELALVGALAHFVRLGEILLEARRRVGQDGWGAWYRDRLGMETAVVSNVMRLAHYRDQLPSEVFECYRQADGRLANPSLHRALPYLRGLPPVNPRYRLKGDSRTINEVRRLHSTGMNYKEIAALVGVHETTTRRWCDPKGEKERVKRNSERESIRQREKRAAAAALKKQRKREERDNLASRTGGELSEAYALIRRTTATLDRALGGAMTGDVRGRIELAIRRGHLCEDEIVLALRSSRQD